MGEVGPAIGQATRGLAYAVVPVALVLAHRNVGLASVLVGLTALPLLVRLRPPRWTWPLLALVAWLSLTTLWTPSLDDRSWAWRLPVAVAAALATVLAAERVRPWEGTAFASAALIGIILLGTEGFTGGALRDLIPPTEAPDRDNVSSARGVGVAVLLLPPALLILHARGVPSRTLVGVALLAATCLAAGVWRFDVVANGLALAAACGAGALALAAPNRAPRLLLLGAAALTLAVPVLALALPPAEEIAALAEGPLSWRQRLLAWRLTADAATADPVTLLFGAGQNASGPLAEAGGTVRFPGAPVAIPRLPDHPHNAVLQLWYEGGLVAIALLVAGLVLAARAVPTWPRGLAAAASAVAAAWLVVMIVEIELWSAWRWACLVLAIHGLRLHASRERQAVVNPSLGR